MLQAMIAVVAFILIETMEECVENRCGSRGRELVAVKVVSTPASYSLIKHRVGYDIATVNISVCVQQALR